MSEGGVNASETRQREKAEPQVCGARTTAPDAPSEQNPALPAATTHTLLPPSPAGHPEGCSFICGG